MEQDQELGGGIGVIFVPAKSFKTLQADGPIPGGRKALDQDITEGAPSRCGRWQAHWHRRRVSGVRGDPYEPLSWMGSPRPAMGRAGVPLRSVLPLRSCLPARCELRPPGWDGHVSSRYGSLVG